MLMTRLSALFVLMFTPACALAQSSLCEDAPDLPLGLVTVSLADTQLDGSSTCTPYNSDVWYKFTPIEDGVLVLDACAATSAVRYSAHSGCPGTPANQIACTTGFSYNCMRGNGYLEVPMQRNVEYRIRITHSSSASTTPVSTYYLPPRQHGTGPDIVAGDIPGTYGWTSIGNTQFTFSWASTGCNIGTEAASWTNQNQSRHHPVIAQSMYQLKDGRIEQLGYYSLLKHGLAAETESFCRSCPASGIFPYLIPGCADTYFAHQNGGADGSYSPMGVRWDVDPTTGYFPYPPTISSGARGFNVPQSAVLPEHRAGARYFAELQFIAADDAAAGNSLNNVSHRELQQSVLDLRRDSQLFVGITQRGEPAVLAWAHSDPAVLAEHADFSDRGITCRFWVASKAQHNPDGTWTYIYSVFNLNADRAGASLMIPRLRGVTATTRQFWMPPLDHANAPTNNIPWEWQETAESMGFACTESFTQNPNANALRWGVMATMSFVSTRPPQDGLARLDLFKPGNDSEQQNLAVRVRMPSAEPCAADFDNDGFVDSFDYNSFVACFEGDCQFGQSADIDRDGFIDGFDYDMFISVFEQGC